MTTYQPSIDETFPHMYQSRISAETLRTLWNNCDKGMPVTLDLAHEEKVKDTLFGLGCSATDDDRYHLCLLRGGELVRDVSLTHVDSRSLEDDQDRAYQHLLMYGLRSGDMVIILHDHNCADDCFGHAPAFISGAKIA